MPFALMSDSVGYEKILAQQTFPMLLRAQLLRKALDPDSIEHMKII